MVFELVDLNHLAGVTLRDRAWWPHIVDHARYLEDVGKLPGVIERFLDQEGRFDVLDKMLCHETIVRVRLSVLLHALGVG
jgi:hypothetical protein